MDRRSFLAGLLASVAAAPLARAGAAFQATSMSPVWITFGDSMFFGSNSRMIGTLPDGTVSNKAAIGKNGISEPLDFGRPIRTDEVVTIRSVGTITGTPPTVLQTN